MTINKAIEILELNVKVAGNKMPSDTLTALKLGIEALRFIAVSRVSSPGTMPTQLVGETLISDSPHSLTKGNNHA